MKKLLCIVLMVTMLASNIAIFAENEAELQESLPPSEAQLKTLRELKIMVGDEDGGLRLSENITRAEAAKMICAVQNIHQEGLATILEPSQFADVWDTHWAKFYINTAKEQNIVEGDENGNFNPEADITNEEIIKMLINVLGYKPMAEQTGGYPAGYLRTAQKLGMTNGLMLKIDVPAIRSDVAVMFANALELPLMVQTGWSKESQEYMIMDGITAELRTLKTEFFKQ